LVEELVQEGRLTADEAAVHPQRSIITRSIGTDPTVDVDIYPVELSPGDRLVLCSDGLTDMVHTEEIAAALRREDDPTRAATALVDAANLAGGVDNITVVVVAVTDEAPLRVLPEPIEPIVATEVDDTPAPVPGERRRRGVRGVGRVLLWALPIVLVLGIAVAAVGWYARKDYYVGANQGQVTVFKGVPGGLAGWDPTIEQRTAVAVDDLKPAAQAQVRDHQTFSSRADAAAFVARLKAQTTTTTTTTTAAPTTTPPTTTTVAPPPPGP
jgi:protein phosphatase